MKEVDPVATGQVRKRKQTTIDNRESLDISQVPVTLGFKLGGWEKLELDSNGRLLPAFFVRNQTSTIGHLVYL